MTVRSITAWGFYWAGDLWWRATDWLCNWFEWPYRVYSWLMRVAFNIQGDGPGPWRPVNRR